MQNNKFTEIEKATELFLMKGIRIKALISELEEAYQTAMDEATSITHRPNDMSVQTSKFNTTESKNISVAAVSEKIRKEKVRYEKIYDEIINLINEVPNTTHKTFLYAKFVNNKTNETIAEVLDVSTKWVQESIYPKAIVSASKVYRKKSI